MPFFKTTKNIFVDHGEYFDPNWMDSKTLVLPPKKNWDYKKEMKIEDVDIWELLYEGKVGVYVAWSPYAEFYLIRPFYWAEDKQHFVTTFYGPNAAKDTYEYVKKMYNVELPITELWVENDDIRITHKDENLNRKLYIV
jgi:hypothetical protein